MREEDQQQQHPRKLVISSSARKSYKRWLFLCGSAAVTLTVGEKKRHTWFSKSSVISYFLYIIVYEVRWMWILRMDVYSLYKQLNGRWFKGMKSRIYVPSCVWLWCAGDVLTLVVISEKFSYILFPVLVRLLSRPVSIQRTNHRPMVSKLSDNGIIAPQSCIFRAP